MCIGATVRTGQDIKCLPHAGFFYLFFYSEPIFALSEITMFWIFVQSFGLSGASSKYSYSPQSQYLSSLANPIITHRTQRECKMGKRRFPFKQSAKLAKICAPLCLNFQNWLGHITGSTMISIIPLFSGSTSAFDHIVWIVWLLSFLPRLFVCFL